MRILMSEVDIQYQLLRDQDLSDSDDESSTDELEQEEVDNISYEEPGRERDSMDDGIQDDGELIQRNLVQDPDILMMFLMQMMLLLWLEPESGICDRDRTKNKKEVKDACAAEIGSARAGAELVQ